MKGAFLVMCLAAAVSGFTLMTYNIRSGYTMAGPNNLTWTGQVINHLNPLACALQEVDVNTQRCPVDQPAELAKATNLKHTAFHKTFPRQGGAYGVALLSQTKPLETAEFAYHEPGNQTRPPCITEDAYCRGAVAMKLEVATDKYIWYVSTHLGLDNTEREGEIQQLIEEFVPSLSKPYEAVFLTGDFNAKPDESPIKFAVNAGWTDMWAECGEGDGFTFSSENPNRRIDFFFQNPHKFTCKKMEIYSTQASDHLPLLLHLEDI